MEIGEWNADKYGLTRMDAENTFNNAREKGDPEGLGDHQGLCCRGGDVMRGFPAKS
jgi:hypothetical protein